MTVRQFFTRYAAKFAVTLVAAAGVALDVGLATGDVAKWIAVGIMAANAAGVFYVPNRKPVTPPSG